MIPDGVTAHGQRRLLDTFTALGIDARAIETVTGSAPWSARPRTFRVTTTTHGDLKVRLMRREHRAARVDMITSALDDSRMPALLGRVGATTVEQWVDGIPLADRSVPPERVAAAADILGTLHRFRGMGRERLPTARSTGDLDGRTTGWLEAFAARRLLSTREADLLSQIANDLPSTAAWGITHTDLGGDNLVVGANGAVVSIDNEHLVRGFLDFDVARSWYRWPLPRSSWKIFLRAYQDRVEWEVTSSTLHAWLVVAASIGVHRRINIGANADVALLRLRSVVDD